MKYYLIAGEASGDLHGARLMQYLKTEDPGAEFRYWGGDLMRREGGRLVKHYRETAFMGLSDVIRNLFKIGRFLRECRRDIATFKPDALILIDYPGFNLRIAAFAKAAGFKVHYYISPKVWAWNTRRAYRIKKDVDYLYTIFPFETAFYKPFGVQPDYIGNPICDAIEEYRFDPDFARKQAFEKPVIALLPGSRRSELRYVLPEMLKISTQFPEYEFVIAGAGHFKEEDYRSYTGERNIRIVSGHTYDLLKTAHAALVCSGTATLETALLGCPQVVCYRFSNLSYSIGRLLIKVKYISLVNLIMERKVVSELIQHEFNQENLKLELLDIISGKGREQMLLAYAALRVKVGPPGASRNAARLIYGRTLENTIS